MQNKIVLLLGFAQMFRKYKASGRSQNEIIKDIHQHLFQLTQDTAWCDKITKSYTDHLKSGEYTRKWLEQELRDFAVFPTSEKYQDIHIDDLHSMSLIVSFVAL